MVAELSCKFNSPQKNCYFNILIVFYFHNALNWLKIGQKLLGGGFGGLGFDFLLKGIFKCN